MNNVLHDARVAAGMTQQQLAEAAGCIRQNISNIELGITLPSVQLAIRLGRILGVEWPKFYSELENECNGTI